MPNTPPNGDYTSTVAGDMSSWSGSFSYTDGTIDYTRTSPSQSYNNLQNLDNGNAINFEIDDNGTTIHFHASTYNNPNGKAQYTGNCSDDDDPENDSGGWTATQN